MVEVDSLEVKIEADAKKAVLNIDSIIKKLSSLEISIKSIDTSSISAQFESISNAMSKIDTKSFSEIGKSAKEAEKSIKKVVDTAKKGITSKISYDTSDYQSVIKELGKKFADAGKGFNPEGDFSSLKKQAENLSKKLETLAEKEQKIMSVGKTSPLSATFRNLQYDISETVNKISALQNAMSNLKIPESKLSFEQKNPDFKIVRPETGFSGMENSAEKAVQNIKSTLEKIPESARYSAEKSQKFLEESFRDVHIDKSQFDKIGETVSRLKDKFAKTGMDFKFAGNFEQLKTEIVRVESELNKLYEKEGKEISTGKVDTSGFERLQESIARLESKEYILRDLKARTDQFNSSLLKLKIPEIKETNLSKLQNSLKKTEQDTEKLRTKLANGITMGGIKPNIDDSGFKRLTTQIALSEKQAQAFKQKINEIGGSSSKAGGFIDNLKKAMSNFSVQSGRASSSSTMLSGQIKKLSYDMKGLGSSFSKAVSGIKSATNSILSAFGIMGGLYGAIAGIKKSIDFASSLTEVQNVIDVTFGKSAKIIEDFAKTSIEKLGMSSLVAKQTAGRYQAMGTALGIPRKEMAKMSVQLTELSADMASFYDVSQSDVAKSLQSVFTGTTMPLRKYGIDLTQTTLEEWAHKRGIDAKIKSMSQAEKMMLRYQYVMERTGAAQGDFQRTIHTWHNQLTLLKENFKELSGVIGTAFINMLKPVVEAINSVMGKVISFSKKILNALGQIFGWEYEDSGGGAVNDYAEGMEDVADSTDKATKKQKEFNKQLSKLDELNNYTSDKGKDKDSGSGNGDVSGIGASEYGLLKAGESITKKFKSSIKDLETLGKTISDTLSKAMESIDWNKIYKKAEVFGSGLAKFLNGLITPRLFYDLGKTLAGALNTALHAIDSFGKTFDWANFGKSLAAGLVGFLENIQWGTALSAAKNWGIGIATALNNFISPATFGLVGTSVANALNTAVQFALNLGKTFDFKNLGNSIATGINNFFSTFDFAGLAQAINTWIKGALTAVSMLLQKTDFEQIGEKIGEFLKELDFSGILSDLADTIWEAIKGAFDLVKGLFKEAPLETALIAAFGILKFTGLGKFVAGKIGTAISGILKKNGIKLGKVAIGIGLGAASLKLANEGKWYTTALSGITTFFAAKSFGASTGISLKIAGVTVAAAAGFSIGKKIGEWVSKQMETENMDQYRYEFKFSDLFTYSPSEWFQGIADMIIESELDTTIQQMLTDLVTGNYHIQIGSFELPSFNDIKKKITNGISDITGAFKELGKYIKKGDYKFKLGSFELPSWNQIKTKVENGISDITGAFEELGKDIKGGNFKFKIGSFELPSWNEIKENVNTVWTNLKNWWNENVKLPDIKMPNIADIKKAISDAWDKTKNWWNEHVKLPKINLPTIADIKKKIQEIWNSAKSWWEKHAKLPKINLPTIESIKDGIKEKWDKAKEWWNKHVKIPDIKFPTIPTDTVKKWLKPIVNVANNMIRKINSLMEVSWKDIKVAGKVIVPKGNFTLAKIPEITGYAAGGFPEDGWFRASHGEFMGKFDNGQSVVANNRQITEGISLAVQEGNKESNMLMQQEISLLYRQNELLMGILEKETGITQSDIFNAVRSEDNAFFKRNGHGAFSY